MEIQIRHPKLSEYDEVEAIMKQVQQMHVDWRPDIYQYTRTVLPFDVFEQSVKDETIFVADTWPASCSLCTAIQRVLT